MRYATQQEFAARGVYMQVCARDTQTSARTDSRAECQVKRKYSIFIYSKLMRISHAYEIHIHCGVAHPMTNKKRKYLTRRIPNEDNKKRQGIRISRVYYATYHTGTHCWCRKSLYLFIKIYILSLFLYIPWH